MKKQRINFCGGIEFSKSIDKEFVELYENPPDGAVTSISEEDEEHLLEWHRENRERIARGEPPIKFDRGKSNDES